MTLAKIKIIKEMSQVIENEKAPDSLNPWERPVTGKKEQEHQEQSCIREGTVRVMSLPDMPPLPPPISIKLNSDQVQLSQSNYNIPQSTVQDEITLMPYGLDADGLTEADREFLAGLTAADNCPAREDEYDPDVIAYYQNTGGAENVYQGEAAMTNTYASPAYNNQADTGDLLGLLGSNSANVNLNNGLLGLLGNDSAVSEWETPTPLDVILPARFPLEYFPATLSAYAKALSYHTYTDPAMAGVALLGILGAVFQHKYEVVSLNNNNEQLSIYSTAIAKTGERKSGVFNELKKPFEQFQEQYNDFYKSVISQNKAQKKLLEINLAKVLKAKTVNEQDVFLAQEALDNHVDIHPLTLSANDTTNEALISLMKANCERMLIYSSEGGVFTHIKGRYKINGDDMELYLKSHSGDAVEVYRKSREETLKKPALSLCIAVQPHVLDNVILNKENDDKGFTGRFAFAYCNETSGDRPAVSADIPTDVKYAYENAIMKCLWKTIEGPGVNTSHIPKLIKLSNEARGFAIQYHDNYTEKRVKYGLERALGWNNKAFGLAIRIAGLFHAFECIEQGFEPEQYLINVNTMHNAAYITEVLATHATKVYVGTDEKMRDAELVLKRIYEMRAYEFNKQDLWQTARGRLSNKHDRFVDAMDILEKHGYIRVEKKDTGGRPSIVVRLNPYINLNLSS